MIEDKDCYDRTSGLLWKKIKIVMIKDKDCYD
jgi:hypothetical protein